MKRLNELYDIDSSVVVNDIKINSKNIEKDDMFVCTMGVSADRHDYVPDAIKNGASCIVASKKLDVDVPVVYVEDTNLELPKICSKFYDHPEDKVTLYGVTGTDGKTTTAMILHFLIGDDKCGYMGTIGRKCAKFDKETANTTPDSDLIYKYFNDFVEAGCDSISMEVSSESYFRNRINGLYFDVAGYTNLSKEHLNIHGTYENYKECKAKLFEHVKKDGYAVLNHDDLEYEFFKSHCNCNVYSYGRDSDNTLQIVDYKLFSNKTTITYKIDDNTYKFDSPLVGEFNVYNLACALLMGYASGYDVSALLKNIKNVYVPGRLDVVKDYGQNFTVMIDYAHTPNALNNLLSFVNKIKKTRIITITGSAGGRYKEKRPEMGKVVSDLSDLVIFTADDPRDENVIDIANDLISGTSRDNYIVEVDRAKAIEKAINMAEKDDIVIIAGRGIDSEMPVNGGYVHCNDFEEATKSLKNRFNK